jgi:hypothetical protein
VVAEEHRTALDSAEGVGGRLADDLPVPAANPVDQDLSDPASVFEFTAASRQIVGKPNSHALRAEAITRSCHRL